jgi:hypothetical protein
MRAPPVARVQNPIVGCGHGNTSEPATEFRRQREFVPSGQLAWLLSTRARAIIEDALRASGGGSLVADERWTTHGYPLRVATSGPEVTVPPVVGALISKTSSSQVARSHEIRTVRHLPLSHPFVEGLIGTMRREVLDHVLFWNARDLERKLARFQWYYNPVRSHASLEAIRR